MDIRANNPTEKLRDGPTNCESKVQLESTLGSSKEVTRCKKPSIAKTNFLASSAPFGVKTLQTNSKIKTPT